MEVVLDTVADFVSRIQHDLLFDRNALRLPSTASCTIDPAIRDTLPPCNEPRGKLRFPCKKLLVELASCSRYPLPGGCPPDAPELDRLRVRIVGLTGVERAIPAGSILYRCTFDVLDFNRLPALLHLTNASAVSTTGRKPPLLGRTAACSPWNRKAGPTGCVPPISEAPAACRGEGKTSGRHATHNRHDCALLPKDRRRRVTPAPLESHAKPALSEPSRPKGRTRIAKGTRARRKGLCLTAAAMAASRAPLGLQAGPDPALGTHETVDSPAAFEALREEASQKRIARPVPAR